MFKLFTSKFAVVLVVIALAAILGAVLIYLKNPFGVARPEKVVATCYWDSTKFANKRCDTCDDPFSKNVVPQGPFLIGGVYYAACCPVGYDPKLENNVIVCNKKH